MPAATRLALPLAHGLTCLFHVRRRRQSDRPDAHARPARRAAQGRRPGAGADRHRRHRPAAVAGVAGRQRRHLGRTKHRLRAACPVVVDGLAAVVRGRPWRHHRRAVPDAGGHRLRRQLLRRRDRRGGGDRILPGGTARPRAAVPARPHRRHEDRLPVAAGLFLRAAVRAVRRLRRRHPVPGELVPARPRIFRARRHALPPALRGESHAQGQRRLTSFSAAW